MGILGVRAEKVTLGPLSSQAGLSGHVALVEHLGAETVVGFRFGHVEGPTELGEAAPRDPYYAKMPGDVDVSAASDCRVLLDLANASYFEPSSGLRVRQPMQPAIAGTSASRDTETFP
jgi:multiple sugar transport system ATP-binding protein